MKTKNIISTFFLFFFSILSISAQTKVFKYANSGSNSSISQVLVDTLGYNYVVGSYLSTFTYRDITITGNDQSEGNLFVLKTNSSGEPIYLEPIYSLEEGDSVSLEKFNINQKGEISLIIKTSFLDKLWIGDYAIDLDSTVNSNLVVKFSKSGLLAWIKVLKTSETESQIYPKDLEIDEQGNVFVAGDFIGDSAIFDDQIVTGLSASNKIFIVKYLNTGDVSWVTGCEGKDSSVYSGSIGVIDMEINPDSNIYIAGWHTGNRPYVFSADTLQCKGDTNAYVACYNSDGIAQWAIPFEADNYVIPEMLTIDTTGNVSLICFYKSNDFVVDNITYTSSSDYDLLICHINSSGEFIWKTNLATNLPNVYLGSDKAYIGLNNSGKLIVLGQYYESNIYKIFFITYNEQTCVLETSVLTSGGSVYLENVFVDKFGNTFVSGTTYGSFKIGENVIEDLGGYGTSYFYRVTDDGTVDNIYQQANTITTEIDFNHFENDAYNNYFIVGSFYGDDANLDGISLSENYTNGMFIAEYGYVGTIEGKAIDDYNNSVPGQVRLIAYTENQTSPIIDAVDIAADGSFKFNNVPNGKYLLQVNPDNSSGSDYLTSYFPSFGNWEDAAIIISNESNNISNIYITVAEGQVFEGESELSGEVTTIDAIFESTITRPMATSRASLAKIKVQTNYQIIANTYTDEEGMYYFNNVPDGEYLVFIDIPGLPTIEPHSFTAINGNSISNINYYVNEDNITAVGSPTSVLNSMNNTKTNSILAYPNPSSGEFNIVVENGSFMESVVITNIQGKTIKQYNNVEDKLTLNDLSSGIYIVNVTMANELVQLKLIVTR